MFTDLLRVGPATVNIEGCIATASFTHNVRDHGASCTPFEITFDPSDLKQGYAVTRGTRSQGVQDSDIHDVMVAVEAASNNKAQ
jgi:hypothetical protein